MKITTRWNWNKNLTACMTVTLTTRHINTTDETQIVKTQTTFKITYLLKCGEIVSTAVSPVYKAYLATSCAAQCYPRYNNNY